MENKKIAHFFKKFIHFFEIYSIPDPHYGQDPELLSFMKGGALKKN